MHKRECGGSLGQKERTAGGQSKSLRGELDAMAWRGLEGKSRQECAEPCRLCYAILGLDVL